MRAGVWRSISLIHRKHLEIEALMIHRAMTVGLEEYNDKAFHMSTDQLDREAMEEAADMVLYEAVYDMIEKKVIP